MPTIEERVAYIEGQVSEQSHAIIEVRDALRGLEHRMESRFEAVDRRFDTVDRRVDVLDEKVSRQFVWQVGLQVTTLVAIVGALLARP
jgi:tetrahydromethanopterin S-methyltransferase subunit G